MNCTPAPDWLNLRVHLDPGCPDTPATVDTWPLAQPWPAGPVPGDHHIYATYATIRQGPLHQTPMLIKAGGWTAIVPARVTADGCAAQVDIAGLRDGRPVYQAGIVTPGTPDYGDQLISAWVIGADCPPPPTTTTTTTTAPPRTPTTQPPEPPAPPSTPPLPPAVSIPPATTTTTVVVHPPTPSLPATGAYTGVEITAALLALATGLALCKFTARIIRRMS